MLRATLFASILLLLGCAPIETVVTSQARVPKNSGITLHLLGPDPAGVEHAIHAALLKAGYQPFSGAIRTVVVSSPTGEPVAKDSLPEQEITRKYQSPYLCQVKLTGRGSRVSTFNLQLIDVASGKILLSSHGDDGSFSGADIAKALLEQLVRISG
jgi:hypothetical protein